MPLIGVSISSSQFKKANLRVKAKRICFDLIKPFYGQLPKNINLVIMPRARVLELTPLELNKEFSYAISGIKIN